MERSKRCVSATRRRLPVAYSGIRNIGRQPILPPAHAVAVGDFDRDGVEDVALQTDEGLDLHHGVPLIQ